MKWINKQLKPLAIVILIIIGGLYLSSTFKARIPHSPLTTTEINSHPTTNIPTDNHLSLSHKTKDSITPTLIPSAPLNLSKQKKSLVEKYYLKSPVLYEKHLKLPQPGLSQRIRVVKTDLKYSLIRVVDTLRENEGTGELHVLNSIAMVADHAMVELPQDTDTQGLFLNTPFEVRKSFTFSSNLLVELPLESFADYEVWLTQLKNHLTPSTSQTNTSTIVEPDYLVYSTATPNDPSFNNATQWSLNNFGQNGGLAGADISTTDAWDIRTDASSVIVGVVDTGIRTSHQDIIDNIWINPGEIPNNGIDDDGNGIVDDVHGLNAIENNGDPTDLDGGFTSDAIEAIDYGRTNGASILNNSWGGGGFSNTLQNAIIRAENADILFVVAAGNDSNNNDISPTFPASYTLDSIVSVASSTRTDSLSNFSNFGITSVDLAAPGSSIFSTFNGSNSSYTTLSGTSMASPHVAGAAAILRAEYPEESFAQIKMRILDTVDIGSAYEGNTLTGGRLNLLGALQNEAVPVPGVISFDLNQVSLPESAESIAVIVNRNIGSAGAVSVSYQTQDGTAQGGSDYTSTSGVLNWTDGDTTERIINIPIIDDTINDGVENFSILLNNPTGNAEIGIGNSLQVTILDNEGPVLDGLTFNQTLVEGGINFTFEAVTPSITVAADGSVITSDILLNNINNTLFEVFRVRKLDNQGNLLWTTTIPSLPGSIGVSNQHIAVASTGEIVLTYANEISTSENEIAAASLSENGTLRWNRSISSEPSVFELPEAVVIGADNAIYIGGNSAFQESQQAYLARVSILDGSLIWSRLKDFEDPASRNPSISSLAVDSEGNVFAGGSTAVSTGFVGGMFSYSANGDFRFSQTYNAIEQQRVLSTLVNPFGEVYLGLRTFSNTTGNFNGRILRVSPDDGEIIWQRAESTVNNVPNFLIASNPNGLIYFIEASNDLVTSNGFSLLVTAQDTLSIGLYNRNGEKEQESVIPINASISLSSIAVTNTGSLWIAGAYFGTAQFGSNFFSSGEGTVDLYLSNLSPTAPISPGELTFESETYSSFESTEQLEITILRENGVDGEASVEISTIEGLAVSGADFLALNNKVITFLPGQDTATFIINLTNDFIPEGSETFSVTMNSPTGGILIGNVATTNVLILNDDFAFEQFLASFFTETELANTNISGEFADPDNDGIDNLTEYAFALNPSVPNLPPSPQLILNEDSTLTIRYQRSNENDLNFVIKKSPDLMEWSEVDSISEIITPIGDGVEASESILQKTLKQHYFRIEATRAELGIGSIQPSISSASVQ